MSAKMTLPPSPELSPPFKGLADPDAPRTGATKNPVLDELAPRLRPRRRKRRSEQYHAVHNGNDGAGHNETVHIDAVRERYPSADDGERAATNSARDCGAFPGVNTAFSGLATQQRHRSRAVVTRSPHRPRHARPRRSPAHPPRTPTEEAEEPFSREIGTWHTRRAAVSREIAARSATRKHSKCCPVRLSRRDRLNRSGRRGVAPGRPAALAGPARTGRPELGRSLQRKARSASSRTLGSGQNR